MTEHRKDHITDNIKHMIFETCYSDLEDSSNWHASIDITLCSDRQVKDKLSGTLTTTCICRFQENMSEVPSWACTIRSSNLLLECVMVLESICRDRELMRKREPVISCPSCGKKRLDGPRG